MNKIPSSTAELVKESTGSEEVNGPMGQAKDQAVAEQLSGMDRKTNVPAAVTKY